MPLALEDEQRGAPVTYLNEALELAAAGKVKPMIEVFPKEKLVDAVTKVMERNVRFRAVVTY
jgi:D-arabinose 1-dehydrogenase-like Zn-dependent alcohol dehydrogenase